MTGLAIVAPGVWTTGKTGAELTQIAFQSAMPGIGDEVVGIALAVLAITTGFGWSYLWTVAVYLGAVSHVDLAWSIADTLNALMAVPNLIALLALSPVVVQLTREHLRAALDSH